MPERLLDARGYKLASGATPGYGKGRVPKSRGRKYPPDPPTAAEVVALMQACPDTPHGHRLRALIALLWRTGLRINEALSLWENDLNPKTGAVVVRCGKGGKRRIVGLDPWGWEQVLPWLEERKSFPPGPVFCVLSGPTAGGRHWHDSDVRIALKKLARDVGLRKRIAPHQFRHALAVDLVREGTPVHLLQRQLGHADLSVTTTYLAGVSAEEVLEVAQHRRAPTLSVPDLMGVLRRG